MDSDLRCEWIYPMANYPRQCRYCLKREDECGGGQLNPAACSARVGSAITDGTWRSQPEPMSGAVGDFDTSAIREQRARMAEAVGNDPRRAFGVGMHAAHIAATLKTIKAVRAPTVMYDDPPSAFDEAERLRLFQENCINQPAPSAGPVVAPEGMGLATSELRPPPEYADKMWHWVQDDCEMRLGTCDSDVNTLRDPNPQIWRWVNSIGAWMCNGKKVRPDAPHIGVYRYLGPAEWQDESRTLDIRYPWPTPRGCRHVRLPTSDYEALQRHRAEAAARIADLEAEVARLKGQHAEHTERDLTWVSVPVGYNLTYEPINAPSAPPLPLTALRGGDGRPK